MARENFTAGRLAGFACPSGTLQAFLWDTGAPGLALRVTAAGARAFIFQSRLTTGQALRMTIGDPATWNIPAARAEARRLQSLLDQGKDPRIEKAATVAAQAASRDASKLERLRLDVRGLDAWAVYCEDRKPHWGERNYADHLNTVDPGGAPRKRAKEKETKPGLLRALLNRPLAELDAHFVEAWVVRETKTRPARAALGFRQLRAFINWCAEHPEYRAIARADVCAGKRIREKLAKPAAKDDALQREQLRGWFSEVGKLPAVVSVYLQTVLLTGCRPGEAIEMRWEDVDFKWGALRVRDKVEGERTIPLTLYVAGLLRGLAAANAVPPEVPRRIKRVPAAAEAFTAGWKPSPWVFASRHADDGRLQVPRAAHMRALEAAALPHLTLHGLRRSFGSLAEWCEVPAGVVAQLQGHKPSATAEKHYRVRPLDLLRMWHQRIEAWILDEAGIACVVTAEPAKLRAVAA